MKAASAIGIGIAIVGLLGGAFMEGTSPASFIQPSAILIIFGGTAGVGMASCGMEAMKNIPALYKKVFAGDAADLGGKVVGLVRYADRARRDGLLALEEELENIDDEFLKKGLQLVVDGTDPDLVREILEAEIEGMTARHRHGAEPFDKAGGFAPTMGIIGTVMGLVHVLQNLSHPETLGPAISSAFIAMLMALSMVPFSMSVVTKSKLASLKASLHTAFSPHVLPGGEAIKQTGGNAQIPDVKPVVRMPAPAPTPSTPVTPRTASAAAAAAAEDRELHRLKAEVDHQAKQAGVAGKVQTKVTRRGLVIDILTDHLLFDSGKAQIKPPRMALLDPRAPLLRKQSSHCVA